MSLYKDAGVDIEAGYKSVKLIREHVKKTFRPEVLTDLGGFGAMFAIDKERFKEPVLVSGTDGVGTKLKIAFLMDKHVTIGIDCVAMCVNDIVCSGAEPLFFLDYLAVGKNYPEIVAQIVKGVADGCLEAGCALIGGETAEMPGFYPKDEYDIAGFAVGIVEKRDIIDGKTIKEGDVLIGIPSTGLHSNGYSLVRKLLNPTREKMAEYIKDLGCDIGTELLKPTKIYVKTILELKRKFALKGICHITGGGFIENIPRMLPNHLRAKINKGSWPVLPIFGLIKDIGNIDEKTMFNTFNMGIGMVIATDKEIAKNVIGYLKENFNDAYIIGEIIKGDPGVDIC